uniref:Uncharacterized protein n=1 Tax=Arion vulgaris TaxID=1028688 RepID=A0A0B7AR01_9EUPU
MTCTAYKHSLLRSNNGPTKQQKIDRLRDANCMSVQVIAQYPIWRKSHKGHIA